MYPINIHIMDIIDRGSKPCQETIQWVTYFGAKWRYNGDN